MNILKVITAALDRRYWPALASRVVPTIEHATPLALISPGTIIDVGANKGQFAYFAALQWPTARLIAFEPLPSPRTRLQRLLGKRAEIYACALGAGDGVADMHVASREDSSSLLPLAAKQKQLFNMEETSTVGVEVHRLDTILAGTLDAPVLLKIDVQGFEYEVLKGAEGLKDRIGWVYVEASFVELYEGQQLADAIAELLRGWGFTLSSEHNLTFDNQGKRVQADLLFERPPTFSVPGD